MNPFFYSEEAGAKGLPPLSPAPQIPAQPKPSLRSGQFRLTIPNTYSTITMPASLRSDCCSPSLRNTVRLPSGIDVHLHRNTQWTLPFRMASLHSRRKRRVLLANRQLKSVGLPTGPLSFAKMCVRTEPFWNQQTYRRAEVSPA
jgi:hypothetical protein